MKLPPFEYACPTTLPEAVELLASHDGDAKAIAGGQSLMPMLAFRLAQPALLVDLRKLADLRGIRISERGVTLGAMVRWRDIEDDERLRQRASAAQGRGRPCRALSDPQSRHRRRQHRACRSGGGNAGDRDDLRRRDRRRRKVRRARDPGRRFLSGSADDGADARRDHRRNPPARMARRPALGIPGIRPPPRRFRHGGGRRFLRPGRARQSAQRPCRGHRGRPIGRCGSPPWRVSSTDRSSTRRRSRRPRLPPPPRSSRRTTFMPAPPIGARSPAPWSSARSRARPLGHPFRQLVL